MKDFFSPGRLLSKMSEDYRSGRIKREEYWSGALHFHMIVARYGEFIRGKGIKSIEINPEGSVIHLESGISLLWDPSDIRNPVCVKLNDGAYEDDELNAIGRMLGKDSVIFDIGANTGWYSCHLSVMAGPESSIYAFEPVFHTFGLLKRNIVLNGLKNVTALNFGLSDREGPALFYVPSWSGSVAASMRPLLEEENRVVTCNLTTLDSFVRQGGIDRMDFVKCDVEGAELMVLRGAMESIERFRPVIYAELLRKWSSKFGYHPDEVIGLLRSLGYGAYCLGAGALSPIERITDDRAEKCFYFLHGERHKALIEGFSEK